jgi:hypothetical protein
MQHYITKCSCGAVIAQCRCPAKGKSEKTVERGCERCKNEDRMDLEAAKRALARSDERIPYDEFLTTLLK